MHQDACFVVCAVSAEVIVFEPRHDAKLVLGERLQTIKLRSKLSTKARVLRK
jgi:hypothetical protein